MTTDVFKEAQAKLTDLLKSKKRRLFVIYYVENGGKHAEAAEAAGFAVPDVEGCRLLRDANVVEAIRRYAAVATNVAGETRDTILARMINRANVDPGDYFETVERTIGEGDDARTITVEDWKPLNKMTKGQRQRIKKISDTQYGRTMEFHDPSAADRDIARLMGLEPKEEHNDLTPEDAASLIASAFERMDETDAQEPERTSS